MINFLPSFILLPITALLAILNIALCGSVIFLLGLVKIFLPFKIINLALSKAANFMMFIWALLNSVILKFTGKIDWQINMPDELKRDGWYLLIANHRSWSDIVVLCSAFKYKLPMLKFFLKKDLFYVPFLGIACWALDMPFMQRYSKALLEKKPHLKGKDIENTAKSCEKFKERPTTIVNFVEGTRFNPEKAEKVNSKYQNLMPPKAAGIAFTLEAMRSQFETLLNVTVIYPDNAEKPFVDLLSGKMKRIIVNVELLSMDEIPTVDYFNNREDKVSFQRWLNDLWHQKDANLEQYK